MKEIMIGEKTIRVRATPLALLYYRQEFKADLVSDLINFIVSLLGLVSSLSGKNAGEISEGDIAGLDVSKIDIASLSSINIDMVGILQLIWAMAKADSYGKPFPGFEGWVNSLESLDLTDVAFLPAALEEAASGFFPGGKLGQSGKRRKARKD